MRNALIASLLVIFFSSLNYTGLGLNPYLNLRKPIYLVTDPSFWSACENDPAGYENCRALRIEQVSAGVNDWFKHFDAADRPRVTILYSKADLPSYPSNDPIYLKIKPGGCRTDGDKFNPPACYEHTPFSPLAIIFDSPEEIEPHFAHEFGHALGRDHDDMPKGVYSVMSYKLDSSYVLPVDIQIMCEAHHECPPHEDTWCVGGFWDECRCPSASYEEGENLFKTGHAICQ